MFHLSRRLGLWTVLPVVLLALGVVALGVVPATPVASAQPPAALPPELQFVPADAAVFVHADAAKLWGGSIGKTVRAADPKLFDGLTGQAKQMFGVSPDDLKSVTAFWPKIKGPGDPEAFGVVLAFNAPYDAARLKAGFEKVGKGGSRPKVVTPSDRIAVVLLQLDEAYARPRPADKTGPLTAAIREAGTGKHLLVGGITPGSLPDELRGDNLPQDVRPFLPLAHAESIAAVVDLAADLSVEVRVRATSPPRASEAEKALGFLAELMQQGLAQGEKQLARDADAKEPALQDVLAILRALQAGLKGTKFATEGDVATAKATVKADLPFGSAFVAAVAKVREAAARAQSSNNLKQIGIAMHNYHDVHGSLPPAAVCDKTGKPMLSWRVLILPYIEQDDLYKQFKLDEPWDSEHNKKLIPKMPKVYTIPTPTKAKANETHYRVFVGKGAMFDYLVGSKLTDIADGTSNTIMTVTAADPVPWTKPDELAFDPDKDMSKLLGYFQSGVCVVGFGDGSVRALSKSLKPKTLGHLIQKNDGEVIDDPEF